MTIARHPKPADIAGLSLDDVAQKFVARFRDRKADWAAFEDAKIEGYSILLAIFEYAANDLQFARRQA